MTEQYFLRISGVRGPYNDAQYKDAIPLTSFQFGAAIAAPSSGGGGVNKPLFYELGLTMAESQASPQLLGLLVSDQPASSAVIDGRITVGSGSTQTQFQQLQISMTNVYVTAFSEGGGSGGAPVDNVSLNYGTIDYSYTPVVNGKPGTPYTFSYTVHNGAVKPNKLEH